MNNRQLFLQHVAQTSPAPIGLEMVKAEGIYQFDVNGKKYVDLISGFSVCNIGHSNPKVIKAVQEQAEKYMHLIVYGEFIESPQVQYAKMLVDLLPENLNSVYFTNSGAEATEGAMKLAKRYTGRSKIISFNKSYHGSTQGALSVMGDEYFRNAFRPLLPDVFHVDYNDDEVFSLIDENTACIVMETVQAEAGIIQPKKDWFKKIREKCTATNTLLILDEIQAGFGRTGSLWAFQQFDIAPDILLLGKALGGGMPLGAFISDINIMNSFTFNPVLGHISTFAGHPVSCAAGKAALEVLLDGESIDNVKRKEKIIQDKIVHPKIKNLSTAGLWACIAFDSFETNKKVIDKCIENGLIADWFLFNPEGLRVAPPLIITDEELQNVCEIILKSIDEAKL
ncbi:aminotransferase class III [Arachidicoccus ginsenosidimutans]|uniref:aspartate aminotransferase family protein n=1 Tax=Arachidicoccus sp. BS20 TaxID=1850526 RepID=UPI0007F06756|nr:aspartate aminotransferase family protein [Arachidicoccus sp. BS20]ANI88989.1 aminotransferase class III [Arachidicoccus sp. BS20]